jgi:hypothetical protein
VLPVRNLFFVVVAGECNRNFLCHLNSPFPRRTYIPR